MLCARPFRSPAGVFGCGSCMPCLINRRRMWTTRIILESRLHEFSSMVTLTYNDDCVPEELKPRDLQLFLKRLRRKCSRPLRFFACGEYGDKTGRPHYHLAVFGLCFLESELVEGCWPYGFVHLGELNEKSAAYIAGYVSKKMRKADVVDNRLPEFIRMSNRPGIGRGAADIMARSLMSKGSSAGIVEDVPHEVRIEGGKFPLGRYMRDALRVEVGWEKGCPEPVIRRLAVENSLLKEDDLDELAKRRFKSEIVANQQVRMDISKRSLR